MGSFIATNSAHLKFTKFGVDCNFIWCPRSFFERQGASIQNAFDGNNEAQLTIAALLESRDVTLNSSEILMKGIVSNSLEQIIPHLVESSRAPSGLRFLFWSIWHCFGNHF